MCTRMDKKGGDNDVIYPDIMFCVDEFEEVSSFRRSSSISLSDTVYHSPDIPQHTAHSTRRESGCTTDGSKQGIQYIMFVFIQWY